MRKSAITFCVILSILSSAAFAQKVDEGFCYVMAETAEIAMEMRQDGAELDVALFAMDAGSKAAFADWPADVREAVIETRRDILFQAYEFAILPNEADKESMIHAYRDEWLNACLTLE